MSRSNYDKPFYVDVGTSIVAIRCASNHDVVAEYDHAWSKGTIKLAEDICDRMNEEAGILNSGDYANAATSGDYANAEVKGKDAIVAVLGRKCKARGALGCWLVLTERDDDGHILGVQAVKVDGESIKADTWYELRGGKVVEAKKEDNQ